MLLYLNALVNTIQREKKRVMNNITKVRRICLQRRHSLLGSIQSNGISSVGSSFSRSSSRKNGGIRDGESLLHARKYESERTLTSTLTPSLSLSVKSKARFFASMPVDQSIAQARNEHIKEGVFNEKTVHSSQEEANTTKDTNNTTADTPAEAAPKKRRISKHSISEVLKAKHTLRWVEPTIGRNSTVREAISVCIDRRLSSMMVIDTPDQSSLRNTSAASMRRSKVVGLATPRDLLRMIKQGYEAGESDEEIFNRKVGDYMTPIRQVIYARPEETIGTCRNIMAKLGVKCLPILSNGRVEGLITARDMAEFGIEASERGGKKHYLENKSERVGLSSDTSMAEPPSYIKAHLSLRKNPLYMNLGLAELPHPYKTPESCGMNRRDYGPNETASNCELSEDANFVKHYSDQIIYVGVADGVGSWREYEVDPREFSHALMKECDDIISEDMTKSKEEKELTSTDIHDVNDDDTPADEEASRKLLSPTEIMSKALERVKNDNIVGSSTACIAMCDGEKHQLNFSNLGDSGIIILRHIDVDEKRSSKQRTTDLKIAFVSQQQLRSFNHPFQLGWTGEDTSDENTSFKTAEESCQNSIHIRRGDIIIMATDGLFDNVELEDIAKIAWEWEQKNGFIVGGDITSREKRWRSGTSMTIESANNIDDLAKMLVERARENSLDSRTDSPFAILAKENDIMWSGGMPDDCTVVAMHIVGEFAANKDEDSEK